MTTDYTVTQLPAGEKAVHLEDVMKVLAEQGNVFTELTKALTDYSEPEPQHNGS